MRDFCLYIMGAITAIGFAFVLVLVFEVSNIEKEIVGLENDIIHLQSANHSLRLDVLDLQEAR